MTGYDAAYDPDYHATHDMYADADGTVDTWRLDHGIHNGPGCRRCGSWCEQCDTERAALPCVPDPELWP